MCYQKFLAVTLAKAPCSQSGAVMPPFCQKKAGDARQRSASCLRLLMPNRHVVSLLFPRRCEVSGMLLLQVEVTACVALLSWDPAMASCHQKASCGGERPRAAQGAEGVRRVCFLEHPVLPSEPCSLHPVPT